MSLAKEFFISIFGYYSEYMLFLTLLSALVLIVIFWIVLSRARKHQKLKTMKMYDIVWRWKWKGKKVVSLWCYCPECDKSLFCDDEYSKLSVAFANKRTFFVCGTCGEKAKVIGGDRKFVLQSVKTEIYKKTFIKAGANDIPRV